MDESKDVLPIYDDAYQAFVDKYPYDYDNEGHAHAYARMVVELSHAHIRHQEITEKLERIAYFSAYNS